ncbi:MAG TPA: zinc ABC transporter substrate-binding protein [Casimicrobiaceae bacterium]|nr:zinc ABC transporter substrate-binding protein [Casimicrobiaceae bacterium]
MSRLGLRPLVLGAALAVAPAVSAYADPVASIAAESVYGDIIRQIGGGNVAVTSVMASMDQDPHEFEPTPAVARAVAHARLVVYNGAGYDAWMERLLSAAPSRGRETIDVAKLAGRHPGDNPHLWYDVAAISALATALAAKLSAIDPAHEQAYAEGLAAFDASLSPLRAEIAAMRARYAGTAVTATEPVFQYMADALGLAMRNAAFQQAVMNDTEPGARTIAAFEDDLRRHAVRALLYNTQTDAAVAQRMRDVANRAGVAVVAITETQPPGKTYPQWMLGQLDALERALAR